MRTTFISDVFLYQVVLELADCEALVSRSRRVDALTPSPILTADAMCFKWLKHMPFFDFLRDRDRDKENKPL
jgi:hypothetical protein